MIAKRAASPIFRRIGRHPTRPANAQPPPRSIERLIEGGISSPLLIVPAFRRMIAEYLNSESIKGELVFEGKKGISFFFDGHKNGISGFPNDPMVNMLAGDRVAISMGDYRRFMLTWYLPQAPPFVPWATTEERSAAAKRLSNWFLNDNLDWPALAKKSPFYSG